MNPSNIPFPSQIHLTPQELTLWLKKNEYSIQSVCLCGLRCFSAFKPIRVSADDVIAWKRQLFKLASFRGV